MDERQNASGDKIEGAGKNGLELCGDAGLGRDIPVDSAAMVLTASVNFGSPGLLFIGTLDAGADA